MTQLIECVPNFSEGRDPASSPDHGRDRGRRGVTLLDVDPGASTHRTVVTFVGEPEPVVEAAFPRSARPLRSSICAVTTASTHGWGPRTSVRWCRSRVSAWWRRRPMPGVWPAGRQRAIDPGLSLRGRRDPPRTQEPREYPCRGVRRLGGQAQGSGLAARLRPRNLQPASGATVMGARLSGGL